MLAKNESQMDRAIRLIIGLVLLVVGSQLGGWLQIVLYILAIIALVTAATGFCLIYKLINFSSAEAKSATEPKAEEPKTMDAVKPETETAEEPAEELVETEMAPAEETTEAVSEEEAELAVPEEPTAEEPAEEVAETEPETEEVAETETETPVEETEPKN